MIRGEKLTAVIPVRSGSKGIPGKNLLKIEGETLIERAVKKAIKTSFVDHVFVTTDDSEMFKIAQEAGAAPSGLRPDHLATSDAKTIDAVEHLLNNVGVDTGYILLLQVTTPLWTVDDLNELCEKFEKYSEAEAIISVVKHDAPHPEKIMKIENGWLQTYLGGNTGVPRQSLPDVYALNGAFYMLPVSKMREARTFVPKQSIPFIMPPERSVNLDGPLDLALLKGLLGDVVSH